MIHIKNTTASYVLLNSSKELHMKENLNIDGEKNMKIVIRSWYENIVVKITLDGDLEIRRTE